MIRGHLRMILVHPQMILKKTLHHPIQTGVHQSLLMEKREAKKNQKAMGAEERDRLSMQLIFIMASPLMP